jgi:hypothetical protein
MRLTQIPNADAITWQWLIDNKAALADIIQRVKATDDIAVVVVQNGVRRSYPIDWSRTNGVIEIRIS